MAKWELNAGPRQNQHAQNAISRLLGEGRTHTEVTGVIGGESHEFHSMNLFGPVRAEVQALHEEIGDRYDWEVTRTNIAGVIGDYTEALTKARESRPVDDQRITPEERAQRDAAVAARLAEEKARADAHDAMLAQVTAKAPAWAKALIVAEYNVDCSDSQTDYFANRTERTVAIGWRSGTREDLKQLRAAAERFSETASVTFTEERHGGSPYLSDHGYDGSGTGWVIKSRALPASYLNLTEDAISEVPAPVQHAGVASAEGVTVRPSSIGKAGVVEIVFTEKPSAEVRAEVKAHGFRWAKTNGCWYGRDIAYAESLVS